MKVKMGLFVILMSQIICLTPSFAQEKRVTLVMKQKMACWEVKKICRDVPLLFACKEEKPQRVFSAVYVGKEPLESILQTLSKFPEVKTAGPTKEYPVQ